MYTILQTNIPADSLVVNAQSTFAELAKEGNINQILDNALTWSIDLIVNILIALLIFFIGRFLISKVDKLFERVLRRSSWDIVLKGFLRTVIQALLYVVLFMILINAVGVKTVSIAAIIGSVGLAVGLAMKDNLANFAGGVILLFNKPFKGGNYIEAQGVAGTVQSVGILYTTLTTFDNKTVHIPNGPLSTGNIINYSTQPTRRLDLTVNVDYGSDVELVKQLLQIGRASCRERV